VQACQCDRIIVDHFRAFLERTTGRQRSHRSRRYLHIEAVFVSDRHLDHLSAALAGRPKLICLQRDRSSINQSQTQAVASCVDAATGIHICMRRNTTMKTVTTFSTRRMPKVIVRRSRKAKYAAVAVAGMLGAVLSVSDASAYTCVRGVYRAGCISRYGAIGVSPNGAMAVGRYGNVYAYHRGSGCFWRNGQRICL
jgi:hypothetical protein